MHAPPHSASRLARGAATAGLLALLLAGVALAAGGPELGEAERARLLRGEVVVWGAAPDHPREVAAAVLIDAPATRVWEVMVDCPHAPEFVPGMRSCRVLEHAADHDVIEHRVKVFAFLPEVRYTFRADYQHGERIDFERTGGDLKAMEGSWTLARVEERTLVRYSVYLDPGFLVPRWAVRRALRSDLPKLLVALRARVLAEGRTEARE
jgi:ribosome-associated toxin RatA of RatAB toxin-antitoxin module